MSTTDKGQSPQKTHLNVNALKNIPSFCDTLKGNHKSETQTLEIEFDGYNDIYLHLDTIFDTIYKLSLCNGLEPMEVINNINVLASLGQKMLPVSELELLDNLLLKANHQNQNFVNVDAISKHFKKEH